MLKIRLTRVGRRHDPSYRVIVVEDSRAAKSGRAEEVLGSYDPRKQKEDAAVFKAERVRYWLERGAKPSSTVHTLLVRRAIIVGAGKNTPPRRRPIAHALAREASTAL